MLPISDAAIGLSASSSLFQFAAFLLMGALVGWLLNDPLHGGACCAPLAIVAVCGAWFGGEFAVLFGRADRGSLNDFAAAFVGAAALAFLWRRRHAPENRFDTDIAARGPRA
jgi:uncharacterized membrane protein YeaQ/YmgE (transglycosylase-associated protein family)